MLPQLELFPVPSPSLRVFCPGNKVVTSFEDYLPPQSTIREARGTQPDLPTGPYWVKPNHNYLAYLPKTRSFEGHLLAPLKHSTPTFVQKDGRWYMDDDTHKLWESLDINLTYTIGVVGSNLVVELGLYEPSQAVKYGFSRGHRSPGDLRASLEISKKAFVHRLAYLTYLISLRYRWDEDLVDQEWWKELAAKCRPTWIDSIWDAVYRQWKARNFAGVVVQPLPPSVRWLRPALNFGVPIWVVFPRRGCYEALDGGFVVKRWEPTEDQVKETKLAGKATPPSLHPGSPLTPPFSEFSRPQYSAPQANQTPGSSSVLPDPPTYPQPPSHPTTLPENAKWYKNWEEFFTGREKANKARLEAASESDKSSWRSRAQSSKGFNQPGKGGAKVYIWESCDSGGFFRILQTRFEVGRDWESYHREALIFSAQDNTWDHCPFMWEPAVEDGPPDDMDDDGDHIMDHWFIEPNSPATPPDDNPSPLEFLYSRYGFLSIEPTTTKQPLPLPKPTAYRIVGLEPDSPEKAPEHLNSFLTDILEGHPPAGHCDLSSSSPPNEGFPFSGRASISERVFRLEPFPLSGDVAFIFANSPDDPRLLVVHESLSVLQMLRAETQPQLNAELSFLLHNGSQFTLLYPGAQPSTSANFNIITFPIRDTSWTPNAEDFRAYMSRLKTFFLERPYAMAAAFSRGGIAWRIAREVLGIEGSVNTLLTTYPNQGTPLYTSRGEHWAHTLHEGEWYYLVGGYEVLTGL